MQITGRILIKTNYHFFYSFLYVICLLCPSIVFGAAWNDPDVTLVQSISDHKYRDANTGQFVSTVGMTAPATTSKLPYEAPTATVTKAPYQAPTATVAKAPYQAPTATVAPVQSTPTTPSTTAATPTAAPTKLNAGKVAKTGAAVLGAAAGGYMVYDSASGVEQHNVGDLLEGVSGGAVAGAAIGSVVPVIGTGTGAAVGAAVGGIVAGSQLFSETDCLTDPETKLYTCCNTVFNKGQRQANIGDYMFCGDDKGGNSAAGQVRQCLQGGSATKNSWWAGLWKDDAWSPDCVYRYCGTQPLKGIDAYIKHTPDTTKICWEWDCIDGYEKSGNTCKQVSTGTVVGDTDNNVSLPVDPYDTMINKINAMRQKIMEECGML